MNLFAQRWGNGIVSDAETGDPLPGATLMVEGTTRGIVTDVDDRVTIELKENEKVLIVSFIGYDKLHVEVGTQTSLKIALKSETTMLQDVIVTAIGI